MPPCLTLSNIRYGSRVKWSNPGKGVAPSPTPWCCKLSKREPSGHPRLWSPTLLLLSHFEKLISDDSKSSAFYKNVFNCSSCLIHQTLWLWFLLQYKSVRKPCMTNAQLGYNDLFSSQCSKSWSPFSKGGLNLEEFIMDVHVPLLLPFFMKEFTEKTWELIFNDNGVKQMAKWAHIKQLFCFESERLVKLPDLNEISIAPKPIERQ